MLNKSPADSRGRTARRRASAAEGPLFLERRGHERRPIGGRVTAVLTGEDDRMRARICSMQLADISAGGIGAMVQEPLPIGAPVTVFWPPHGAEPGFDLMGTVARCVACDWGYHVGLRVDSRLAA